VDDQAHDTGIISVPDDAGEWAEDLQDLLTRFVPGWGSHLAFDRGWYPLVSRANRQLRSLWPEYRVHQVKEKFGTLRFYAEFPQLNESATEVERNTVHGIFSAIIQQAEIESGRTCEVCAAPGRARPYVRGVRPGFLQIASIRECSVGTILRRGKQEESMSYRVLGRVHIRARPAHMTTSALLVESVMVRYPDYYDDFIADWKDEVGSPIARALSLSGFTSVEETTDDSRQEIDITGEYDGLGWLGMSFVHHLAAESGMDLRASFRAQDYEVIETIYWSTREGKAHEIKHQETLPEPHQ
jgi:hypothetical protein